MLELGQEICRDLNFALSREWLETNGIGGFSSSTISGLNTRRYHGLLTAASRPPVGRFVLLSKLEETLLIDDRRYELSANQYSGVMRLSAGRLLTTNDKQSEERNHKHSKGWPKFFKQLPEFGENDACYRCSIFWLCLQIGKVLPGQISVMKPLVEARLRLKLGLNPPAHAGEYTMMISTNERAIVSTADRHRRSRSAVTNAHE